MRPDAAGTGAIPPAAKAGLTAFLVALIAYPCLHEWAAVPLGLFVFLCLAAPFYPTAGFFLPVVSRGKTGEAAVSVTFDDGPDPETTGPLLQLLARHGVKATFFVTGENANQYRDLIATILHQGHDIGNHSYHHDPFLMLRRSKTIFREIESTQSLLKGFGIVPAAFRPPVGITNPKLAGILRKQRMYCLTFSCRAYDCGNRRLDGLGRKILRKVRADDIILLHDVQLRGGRATDDWLREVETILSGLKERGLQPIPLAELIRQPIMLPIDSKDS